MSDETIGYIILAAAAAAMLLFVAPVFWHSAEDRKAEREKRTERSADGKPYTWQNDGSGGGGTSGTDV